MSAHAMPFLPALGTPLAVEKMVRRRFLAIAVRPARNGPVSHSSPVESGARSLVQSPWNHSRASRCNYTGSRALRRAGGSAAGSGTQAGGEERVAARLVNCGDEPGT